MVVSVNLRFQIAALLVLLLVVIDYVKTRHLRLRSSRYFKALLFTTVINIILDMCCVAYVVRPNGFNRNVVTVSHQLFLATLITAIFFEYLYIRMMATQQSRLNIIEYIVSFAPLVFAAGAIFMSNMEIEDSHISVMSYGHLAYIVYSLVGFYFILETYYLTKARHMEKCPLDKHSRFSMYLSMALMLATFGVDIIFRVPVTAFGLTLLILNIYFPFENQRENTDSKLGCFNRQAFDKMLWEYYSHKKELYVINLTCNNIERIREVAGKEAGIEALRELSESFAGYTQSNIYRTSKNVLTMFWTEELSEILPLVKEFFRSTKNDYYGTYKLYCNLGILDVKRFTTTADEVEELMTYVYDHHTDDEDEIFFLDDEIMKLKNRHDKLALMLEEAVENNGFEMNYQPIYDAKKKRFASAEALIRLKDCKDLGFVSPEEFIPMAEEKGLILQIGDMVLEMVAEFASKNNLMEKGLDYIEINLSALQVVIPDLDKRLAEIVRRHNIPEDFINLEITETAMINYCENFENNLIRLRRLGFSFSMDDFGTGYSSLSQMNEIDYDLVKIDKSLIWKAFGFNSDAKHMAQARELLHSIITMLHNLNIGIVAEGVETVEMEEYLKEQGVEHLQGFYYSKPVPGDQFIKYIQAQCG